MRAEDHPVTQRNVLGQGTLPSLSLKSAVSPPHPRPKGLDCQFCLKPFQKQASEPLRLTPDWQAGGGGAWKGC